MPRGVYKRKKLTDKEAIALARPRKRKPTKTEIAFGRLPGHNQDVELADVSLAMNLTLQNEVDRLKGVIRGLENERDFQRRIIDKLTER